MKRNLANYLTVARFFMAIAFFFVIGCFHAGKKASWPVLDVAFVIFLVAVLTDIVDGYIARKMGQVTVFGRITDPFVDKILVCGTLVFFAGNQFVGSDGVNLTGLKTWMVVLIIARELLVTGIRGFSESHSVPFPASWSGKVKMILQTVTICWILVYVKHWTAQEWAASVRDVLIWTTVVFTAISGFAYVDRGRQLLQLESE